MRISLRDLRRKLSEEEPSEGMSAFAWVCCSRSVDQIEAIPRETWSLCRQVADGLELQARKALLPQAPCRRAAPAAPAAVWTRPTCISRSNAFQVLTLTTYLDNGVRGYKLQNWDLITLKLLGRVWYMCEAEKVFLREISLTGQCSKLM